MSKQNNSKNTFENFFASPGNSATLGYSFESLCGKSGPERSVSFLVN